MRVEPGARSDAIAKLARADVLAGVDQAALAVLARGARLVDARGADLEPGLLVLLSGHAAVFARRQVVELPGQGELIGEEHVFGAAGRGTARLLGRATALAVRAEAVRGALEYSPRLVRVLLENLARRELRILQRMECSMRRRGLQRLAGYLLRQLPARDAPQLLRLPAPKVILASLLSMSKESFSRCLARLSAAALITVRGRDLRVPAPCRLAEACDCPSACTACDRGPATQSSRASSAP
jgi:CRP-like cAMP-binding protein